MDGYFKWKNLFTQKVLWDDKITYCAYKHIDLLGLGSLVNLPSIWQKPNYPLMLRRCWCKFRNFYNIATI
jgi:hypothetical protein